LTWNQLEDDGIVAIAGALKHCLSLKSLW